MSLTSLPEPDKDILNKRKSIVRDLRKRLPGAVIIEDEAGRRTYETDALGSVGRLPLLVVLPGSTAEVSELLAYCNAEGVNVVARGAGTSLCGGAVPTEDSVVLGLTRMRRILALSPKNGTARVESGVTNQAISDAAKPHGFFYVPDPSSAQACSIGGNIATNAGGARCLKYGVTGNNVIGVKLVLMDGEVIELGGDYLDNSGLDLLGLITGSEGQLGVVTEATVRLFRRPTLSRPMLVGFSSTKDAGSCIADILRAGMTPSAIEFMDRRAIEHIENYVEAGYPRDVDALLLIEVEGENDNEIRLQMGQVRDLAGRYGARSIREAQTEEESEKLWLGRRAAFGAMGAQSDYASIDGVIPISRIADVLGWVDHIARHYGFEVVSVFHAGDGNLHSMLNYNPNDEEEISRARECGAELLRLCIKAGGCLTGQHGIGLDKREQLRDQYGDFDLVQQTRVKTVFDPQWLLNPAKVFPLDAPGRGGIEAEIADLVNESAEAGE